MNLRVILALLQIIIKRIFDNKVFYYCVLAVASICLIYLIVHYYNYYLSFSEVYDLNNSLTFEVRDAILFNKTLNISRLTILKEMSKSI